MLDLQAVSLEHFYPVEQCSDLVCFPHFLEPQVSLQLAQQLISSQTWPDTHYQVFGRTLNLPRQQTWHADDGVIYSYNNNLLPTRPWTPLLSTIRALLQGKLKLSFNAVLMNHYRDGNDYVGWHADDDTEMGEEPFIASLSLGAERLFSIRQNQTSLIRQLVLPSGSLILMKPNFQKDWQHAVSAEPNVKQARINLTFRYVIPPSDARSMES